MECVCGGRGEGRSGRVDVKGCPGFGVAPDIVREDTCLFPISCPLPPCTSVNVWAARNREANSNWFNHMHQLREGDIRALWCSHSPAAADVKNPGSFGLSPLLCAAQALSYPTVVGRAIGGN